MGIDRSTVGSRSEGRSSIAYGVYRRSGGYGKEGREGREGSSSNVMVDKREIRRLKEDNSIEI